MRGLILDDKKIPGQIMENVSPNRHFLNLSFTKKNESWKTYLENQLPKGHFPNNIFRISLKKIKKNLTLPNPWKNDKKNYLWKNGGKSWKKFLTHEKNGKKWEKSGKNENNSWKNEKRKQKMKKVVKNEKNCKKWKELGKTKKKIEKNWFGECTFVNWFLGNVFQDSSVSIKSIFGKYQFDEPYSRLWPKTDKNLLSLEYQSIALIKTRQHYLLLFHDIKFFISVCWLGNFSPILIFLFNFSNTSSVSYLFSDLVIFLVMPLF